MTQNADLSTSENYLTDGGAFSESSSHYGTYDQGGNVYEWCDTAVASVRILRGGNWIVGDSELMSSYRFASNPISENSGIGFRVASSIPEPSAALLLALSGAGWLLWKRRRVAA